MMTETGSKKRTVVAALVASLASVCFLVPLVIVTMIYRQPDGQLSSNRNFTFAAADRENNADTADLLKYAYVILTYHKSGHNLSHVLQRYLEEHTPSGSLKHKAAPPRTQLNASTGCIELSLEPGTITLIEAPEFHCNEEQLAELFMVNPSHEQSQLTSPKLGVKVIHLVRNPFSMAVSNYHYHSQSPTPEQFVHWKDPCSQERKGIPPVVDLVMPLLSDPVAGPIMTRDDFQNIVNGCYDIYQTRKGLTNASYYQHLLALHPREGLRLATADKFNHFALMANDLIMLNKVKHLVRDRSLRNPWRCQEFDMIIMPMDDWIEQPGESMFKFLDFAFGDLIPDPKKGNLSNKYEKYFQKKRKRSLHITSGKHTDTAELMGYLREDALFGGPLMRIESLLNEVLHLSTTQE